MSEKHFYEQKKYTEEYLLPYFQKNISDFHKKNILEVGCAEGGLLDSLQNRGMNVFGIELSQERAQTAILKNKSLKVLVGDISDPELMEKLNQKFDVIIMREVIEHIPDKVTTFKNLDNLLNANGFLFISFPPKRSPFAGHQQIGRTFMKMIPYLHILPTALLKNISKWAGEDSGYIDEIKFHYNTGCTINVFETNCALVKFKFLKMDLYLFRPIYAQRFGIPVIKLPDIPLLREFISFGCEALLQKQ